MRCVQGPGCRLSFRARRAAGRAEPLHLQQAHKLNGGSCGGQAAPRGAAPVGTLAAPVGTLAAVAVALLLIVQGVRCVGAQ